MLPLGGRSGRACPSHDAPQEVTLQRRGQEVHAETKQMRKRIRYMHLQWSIPEEQRREVLQHCGHCTARLFLEGRSQPEASASTPSVLEGTAEPATKRPRTAKDCLTELKDLKALLDCNALTPDEFTDLKAKLLRGE